MKRRSSVGPGWGYGGWYGVPWGGGQELRTRHYKVGTLVMDIVDREKKQAVFQGGLETVVSKEMLQKKDESLRTAVAQLFAKYPFVAGQSAPVALPETK